MIGASAAPEVMMMVGSMMQRCYYSALPSGPVISAGLFASPRSSDHIFISM
jgi:hypothetical protein